MTTDSTSVLKDCRHPSLSSVHLSSGTSGATTSKQKLGRVVSLQRSGSTATAQPSIRPRYLSEGHDNSKDNLHSSKLFICTQATPLKKSSDHHHPSGSSLCVSMDFEFQGIVMAPTPSLVVDNAAETTTKLEVNCSFEYSLLRGDPAANIVGSPGSSIFF